jgi:hypothetical protein
LASFRSTKKRKQCTGRMNCKNSSFFSFSEGRSWSSPRQARVGMNFKIYVILCTRLFKIDPVYWPSQQSHGVFMIKSCGRLLECNKSSLICIQFRYRRGIKRVRQASLRVIVLTSCRCKQSLSHTA